MYIGPWQEYKLASQMRRHDWKEHKQLKEFYTDWQKKCKALGEVQATNELVWGPLFASLHGTSNDDERLNQRKRGVDNDSIMFQTSYSAKHGSRRKLNEEHELRATQPMKSNRNFYHNNNRNTYHSNNSNREAKKWDIQKYNQMKRKKSTAGEGDKIIYANPKRYKPASQTTSLLPSLFHNSNSVHSSLPNINNNTFYNNNNNNNNNNNSHHQYYQKENDSRYSPPNVSMKYQQQMSYKLKRSPIRTKKKKRSKKQTEKAKRLEKRNPYIQQNSPPSKRNEPTTATHFLPPVDINVKYTDHADVDTNRYFTNNNDKLMRRNNRNKYIDNKNLSNISRQSSSSQKRVGSPASDIFEDEVDALLDWTDLLVPEMVG